MNNVEQLLLKFNYKAKSYGYTRSSKNNQHWVTEFPNDIYQLYAYDKSDKEYRKVYDTGMVTLTKEELIRLLEIFTKNHQ